MGRLGLSVRSTGGGDGLFVASAARARHRGRCANTILVKIDQVGTLTETRETVALALSNGSAAVNSQPFSEIADSTVGDRAVAAGCGLIVDYDRRRAVPHRPHCQVQPAHVNGRGIMMECTPAPDGIAVSQGGGATNPRRRKRL